MTETLVINSTQPDPTILRRAAEVLRAGGLVAFPTETVYGLGANALDAAAVQRIFDAKGRPATNPVIVHVAEAKDVAAIASDWPRAAEALAARFWPGPLTLVLPKRTIVPEIVTAGGPTVAVRCPAHPVASALIREAGVPVAAPSANRSTELSPTRAEHVLKSLNGRIDVLLDGGPCTGGIESTVVDVTGEVLRVLRPGLVSVPMLEAVVGRVLVGEGSEAIARSPGRMLKHYSPRAKVLLFDTNEAASRAWNADPRAAWLSFGEAGTVAMPTEAEAYAARLYDEFHRLDDRGIETVMVTLPPGAPEWIAIRDRLQKAAVRE